MSTDKEKTEEKKEAAIRIEGGDVEHTVSLSYIGYVSRHKTEDGRYCLRAGSNPLIHSIHVFFTSKEKRDGYYNTISDHIMARGKEAT